MTHVTCRLTAKKRDQLWNPTLGNRVWATTLARHLATGRVTSTRYMNRVNSRRITKLTGVDESPGSAFAELLGFVGQRYFYDARDMSRRCVHLYGVRRQQLQHHTSPSRRRSSSYHTNTMGRRDDMPPPRRWQFYSRRICVHPRTGPQSAHLWWPASCRQPACR